jgi:hypothetical protein
VAEETLIAMTTTRTEHAAFTYRKRILTKMLPTFYASSFPTYSVILEKQQGPFPLIKP